MADEKSKPLPGTDATTAAEQGIGSGVGTGWDGTIAGSIDGQGNSVGTGLDTVGAGYNTGTGIMEDVGEQLTPGIQNERGIDKEQDTIDLVGGVGVPPRTADGSIYRDSTGTIDAERLRTTKVVTGPDIGGIPDELLRPEEPEDQQEKK